MLELDTLLEDVFTHRFDIFLTGVAQDLDDFNELVNARLAREKHLAQKKLSDDAPNGPDVDALCVVLRTEEQLRRTVVPRADI